MGELAIAPFDINKGPISSLFVQAPDGFIKFCRIVHAPLPFGSHGVQQDPRHRICSGTIIEAASNIQLPIGVRGVAALGQSGIPYFGHIPIARAFGIALRAILRDTKS